MNETAQPPDFPSGIPITRQTFENWAQMIEVPDVWTCAPTTVDDVVNVCNWAARERFTVRAHGVGHTWSPLTVTQSESTAGVVLVDMQHLAEIHVSPAAGDRPAQVTAQCGARMLTLMQVLQAAPGGTGPAPGFSFPHIPAPGNITVGGVLAINGHGTAVPTPPFDDFDTPYGSLSNQILGFTAVVTKPGSDVYEAVSFTRGDPDARAFLTHCGRALLLDVTLQVVDNYYLRCESIIDVPSATLFAAPADGGSIPAGSVGEYLEKSGRIEVIWFPAFEFFGIAQTSHPWLKVWTVEPNKPETAREVTAPYNYPFSDHLPDEVTKIYRLIVSGVADLTPVMTRLIADFTAGALQGSLGFEKSTDLWGASLNTLLYVQDATLRVTANGYAVLMKRDEVQQAIHDFTAKFQEMLDTSQAQGRYPINSPLEIRVTGLDQPGKIRPSSGRIAQSPVISSLSVDPVVEAQGWDVACWFDVLTVVPPGDPQGAYGFYEDLESWCQSHFGSGFRLCPEWSKGWAYTASGGAWTKSAFIEDIRDTFTVGRPADATWKWEVDTLAAYDRANLFSNPFLDRLFTS